MDLRERIYSVLIVCSNESYRLSLRSLLSSSEYGPVDAESSLSNARRILLEKDYDIVIVDHPDALGDAIGFACDESDGNSTILVLVPASEYDDSFSRLMENGVFAVSKPLSRTSFLRCMDMMRTVRIRLGRAERITESLEEKMAELRAVSRAKLLLMEKTGLGEEAAHRHLEKLAMNNGLSKIEVARLVIDKFGRKNF